jgi:non-ribosomal peptide synthase protein (TIGR01720 family)
LLLLGHHIVLDGVSWQVILEDLATLVTQAIAGEPLQLPATPPGASARAWALGLEARAATPTLAVEVDHWLRMPADEGAMPVDLMQADSPTEASTAGAMRTMHGDAAVVTLTLASDETRALLHEAPARLDGTAQALLLTALLLAWSEWTGHRVLRLDLEGHGRDVLGNAIDASRIVGWFTTVFPVRLELPPTDVPDNAPSIATTVRDVRRALDTLPLRGAAHGLLRYLAPDARLRARLGAAPRPALLFNYLGTHDLTLPPASHLRLSDEASGRQRSPDVVRPYLIEINCRVQDGRLVVVVEYSTRVHRTATMEHFSALLRDSLLRIAGAQPAAPGLSGLDAAGLQVVADLLGELDGGEGWDGESLS